MTTRESISLPGFARLEREHVPMETGQVPLDPVQDTVDTGERASLAWDHEAFQNLIDRDTGVIGRVVSSEREPAGSHEFFFWAGDDAQTLDVGHIVVAFSEQAAVIGVVDEPRRYSDLRSFLDDYFDRHMEHALSQSAPTVRPEILVFTVKVLATRHLRDDVQSHRPAVNGPVFFANETAIRFALGTHNFTGAGIPALMHTNGNYERDDDGEILLDDAGRPRFQRTPLFLDEDYLLGPEAGHANWTGQSGLATKTSHALFLIGSVFQTMEREQKSVAAIMFNVKGPDLLWLDKPAQPDPVHESAYRAADWKGLGPDDLKAYESLGVRPEPFDGTRVFAPFRPGMDPQPINGSARLDGFSDHKALNTARQAPGETDRVFPILWSLKTALTFPHKVFDFSDLDDKMWGFIYELREMKIDSLAALNEKFAEINAHFANDERADNWHGHHKATIRKAQNRFKGLKDKLGGLLAEGGVDFGSEPRVDHPFANHELRVVDISNCNTTAQELIVTSTINTIWRLAERSEMGVDKLIVFVDELNKYAPSGGDGGLRDTLVDIAARGRHLNVVLLGAQQFRSKVDGEILGNCGTSFYGRVGDEEIINAAYRSISETAKQELLGLPKGRLLVRHAHFRAPLFGTFPHPPTLPGVYGQRIFGSEAARRDPADALHRTLKKLMGDRAPALADVRNLADGIEPEAVDDTRRKIESIYGTSSNGHGDPWRNTQKMLNSARDLWSRT
ncbi:MAG: Bipolar DNA helicase HerA [uncultured Thermomicrobiales bacterium]|uniref:Bipolar DNA helicase HerA n=1 Tax=uncultured Thermomicrobiales bacterium TaxID=1645740 RepID=A0A6J4V3C1_9BACT|nr:MAG: Bipolar DNA helicase HerA [uncultured Thermomicrobiales bacterium]